MAASNNAFVTLLTSDHYLPGALVLAQSLRLAHHLPNNAKGKATDHGQQSKFDIVALITPETLSIESVKALSRSGVFDWIVGVEQIGFKQILATRTGSSDPERQLEVNDVIRQMEKNLNLLGRPDLQNTLTKLHAWRLGRDSTATIAATAASVGGPVSKWQGYDKVIFLDADMLVLRPIDHLFSLSGDPNFAASPDTGWPDAFNSGLMLFKPSEATFDSIRRFARERGSWDGADQGLLNDYYGNETDADTPLADSELAPGGGWKRLSFRYNVTSHGGYTFAPAYQRYGTSILAAHFIGQNKPWNRLKPEGAADPNPHSGQRALGRPGINPSQSDYLLALWHDTYSSLYPSSSLGSPSGQIEIVHTSRGVEVVERRAFTVPTYHAVWDVEATLDRQREIDYHQPFQAHYHSLPLDGRASLIAPEPRVPTPPTPTPADYQRPAFAPAALISPPAPQHHSHSNSDDEGSDHFSPPQLSWNAAYEPPPADRSYQMRNPPETYYQNAWDDPKPAPRTLAEQKAAFFMPQSSGGEGRTGGPGYIPPRLRRDHTFDNLGGDRPDPSKIKPVFPWEKSGKAQPAPSRVFPDDPKPRPAQPINIGVTKNKIPNTEPPSPAYSLLSNTSSAIRRGLPVNLAYTNAWDQDNAIGNFAKRWTHDSSPRKEAVEKGIQATSNLNNRAAQNRIRAGNSADPSMSNFGVGTYDQGEDTGAQSDSRDGDDESSDDDDSSDDDQEEPRVRSPTWPREGPGKGYTRKAEMRSPKPAQRFLNFTDNSAKSRIRPDGWRSGSGSGSNSPTAKSGSEVPLSSSLVHRSRQITYRSGGTSAFGL